MFESGCGDVNFTKHNEEELPFFESPSLVRCLPRSVCSKTKELIGSVRSLLFSKTKGAGLTTKNLKSKVLCQVFETPCVVEKDALTRLKVPSVFRRTYVQSGKATTFPWSFDEQDIPM